MEWCTACVGTCACVCTGVCGYMCIVCLCMERTEDSFGCHSSRDTLHHVFLSFEMEFLIVYPSRLGWLARKLQGSSCLCLAGIGITGAHHQASLLWTQTQVLVHTEQVFVNRPISPGRLRALQSPLAGVNNVGSKEEGTGDPGLLSCCRCPWSKGVHWGQSSDRSGATSFSANSRPLSASELRRQCCDQVQKVSHQSGPQSRTPPFCDSVSYGLRSPPGTLNPSFILFTLNSKKNILRNWPRTLP